MYGHGVHFISSIQLTDLDLGLVLAFKEICSEFVFTFCSFSFLCLFYCFVLFVNVFGSK